MLTCGSNSNERSENICFNQLSLWSRGPLNPCKSICGFSPPLRVGPSPAVIASVINRLFHGSDSCVFQSRIPWDELHSAQG
jgi:hypothetical protein